MGNTNKKPLTTDVPQLHTLVYELEAQVHYLEEQIHLMAQRQFGAKTDHVDVNQITLFDSDETELVDVETPSEVSSGTDKTVPQGDTNKQTIRVLKGLPVVREDIELPVEERQCDHCHVELKDIGSDVQRQIDYQPASLTKREIHRHKYACPCCDQTIKRAPAKPVPIPKSVASPSLLSHLIVSKYADHLPLYRIDQRLERLGLHLPRKTQGDWLAKCGELLAPISKIMMNDVLSRGHVYTDDTILPMQNDDHDRQCTIQSRIWVYRTDQQQGPPIVTYDFSRSRAKGAPAAILQNYRGYLQADAYTGYDHLFESGEILEVACWAHTRRKFVEAAKLTKKTTRAHMAVKRIKALYQLEQQWKSLGETELKELRQAHTQPLLEEFKAWLLEQANAVLPKSALGNAINYALRNWDALYRYSTTGHLNIDNNLAEQSMRPIALGRKNYLFGGSEAAGNNAAVLYSIVETCKVNQLNPLAYLTYLLDTLPQLGRHPEKSELKALLPYTSENLTRFKLG
jgi:transposase